MTADASAADFDRTAATIASARRLLVTGLVGAEAAVAVAACDLAEACGAAVDPGHPETSRVVGPVLARIGAVTAAAEELRDRADLVVFWFVERGVVPADLLAMTAGRLAGDATRRTIAIGPLDVAVLGTAHQHLLLPEIAAVDAARLAEAAIRGMPVDAAAADPDTLAAARDLVAAITAAGTVALVTDWRRDELGLAAWSTVSLLQALAHRKPAFEVPLGERRDAAIDVCTWRFGAAGAIERADRKGGRFRPAEGDAARLIDRREVDCVAVVGRAAPDVEAALARAGVDVTVVRLPADVPALRQVIPRISGRREPTA